MIDDGEAPTPDQDGSSHETSIDRMRRSPVEVQVRSVEHDLGNLLMVISSYTEMLRDSFSESDPRRKKAQEVVKAATRAMALTRQWLGQQRRHATGSG